MPEIVNRAVIRAPVERVFSFISQAERNVEWVPDLTASERLTPGPTGVGTRFRFTIKMAGIPFPVDVTDQVVAFEPNRLIRFEGVRGPRHLGYWQMESLPATADGAPQTAVTYGMDFELPPGLGPLVARLINLPERLDQQSRACLANLRRILE